MCISLPWAWRQLNQHLWTSNAYSKSWKNQEDGGNVPNCDRGKSLKLFLDIISSLCLVVWWLYANGFMILFMMLGSSQVIAHLKQLELNKVLSNEGKRRSTQQTVRRNCGLTGTLSSEFHCSPPVLKKRSVLHRERELCWEPPHTWCRLCNQ